jgi:hypothetical protein
MCGQTLTTSSCHFHLLGHLSIAWKFRMEMSDLHYQLRTEFEVCEIGWTFCFPFVSYRTIYFGNQYSIESSLHYDQKELPILWLKTILLSPRKTFASYHLSLIRGVMIHSSPKRNIDQDYYIDFLAVCTYMPPSIIQGHTKFDNIRRYNAETAQKVMPQKR